MRAYLVGNDSYQSWPLRGCRNDALAWKEFLSALGWPRDEILTSLDCGEHEYRQGLEWLASGDGPLFHAYSGHGIHVPDRHEPDGMDEAIVLVDDGKVTDDDYIRLFHDLKSRLFWVSDSCHSGDLSREPSGFRTIPTTFWGRLARRLHHARSDMISFMGACQSNEVAHETRVDGVPRGAFTTCLMDSFVDGMTVKELVQGATGLLVSKGYGRQTPFVDGGEDWKFLHVE